MQETWFIGLERVDIAREARYTTSCALCHKRKAALSPFSVDGEHDTVTNLPRDVVDATHRLVTDTGRLTKNMAR